MHLLPTKLAPQELRAESCKLFLKLPAIGHSHASFADRDDQTFYWQEPCIISFFADLDHELWPVIVEG